jgi:hypothetical protein
MGCLSAAARRSEAMRTDIDISAMWKRNYG